MTKERNGIARRDFLRIAGVTGLGIGLGFEQPFAEAAQSISSSAEPGDVIVGLEIGTSKICVVVAERSPDGSIRILGTGQAPSHGVSRFGVVDPKEASQCVRAALVEAEIRSDVMIRSVVLAVTGTQIPPSMFDYEQAQNKARCVRDIGVEIETLVLARVASAEAVLTAEAKSVGARSSWIWALHDRLYKRLGR